MTDIAATDRIQTPYLVPEDELGRVPEMMSGGNFGHYAAMRLMRGDL